MGRGRRSPGRGAGELSARLPAGLTADAWQLFAVFAAAIFAVITNAFPLLTASLLASGAVALTGTLEPSKAFSGFANASVLLVICLLVFLLLGTPWLLLVAG